MLRVTMSGSSTSAFADSFTGAGVKVLNVPSRVCVICERQPSPMLVPAAGLHSTPAVAPKVKPSPSKDVLGPLGAPVANLKVPSAYWICAPIPTISPGATR